MQLKRLSHQYSFPPYAFVPGKHPHPHRPGGHSYFPKGQKTAHSESAPLDPYRPFASEAYLFALDLYNFGFYWESHEWWEDLWNACQRTGPVALFLKGLIKLGAAGVKARLGQVSAVVGHAQRAHELFQEVMGQIQAPENLYGGLDLRELLDYSLEIQKRAQEYSLMQNDGPLFPPLMARQN